MSKQTLSDHSDGSDSRVSLATSAPRTKRGAASFGECCPYLYRSAYIVSDHIATDAGTDADTPSVSCQAVSEPFIPSAVHQSSCCLNTANFMRCPYYVAAEGQRMAQRELQSHKPSFLAKLRTQIAHLLPFGGAERKKRKRIYFIL